MERWEVLQAKAVEKDFRLRQHRTDWTQFRIDLDNMIAWLDEAEALQLTHGDLSGEITHLDTIIRQHKDFLVQLESKKARVLSINLISKTLIDNKSEEGRQLKARLRQMNKRWEVICQHATQLQKDLQRALMQCQEFHHTIHDLLLWLENLETRIQQCEPIDLMAEDATLWSKHMKLVDLKLDLEKNRPRVMSLKETADQLLENSDSTEMAQAKDKMHIIANRLKALLRLCSSYISCLEDKLDINKSTSATSHSHSLDLSGSGSSDLSSPRGGRTSTPSRPSVYRPGSSTPLRTPIRTRSPFAVTRQV
ncbi:hypothetical protein ACJMK2_037880 [Sinanodonta woodiana]|uniref:Dystrophin n=1 Tax=Sinanodonta woodiana TaxID=1069815 RepID=A0ABD3WQ96_SINWO